MRAQYNAVAALRDGPTTLAATARLGQIAQSFADQLRSTAIPRGLRVGQLANDRLTAYCDRLSELTEPLDDTAVKTYRGCLSKSHDLGWFDEWSALCERELAQLRPEDFSTQSELRGASVYTRPVIDIEPPELELN